MGQGTDIEGIAARRAALALVTAATEDGRLFSETTPAGLAKLEPAQRARAGRLAAETLRWASRADRILGPYLRMKPRGRTHNALRMGVWEICADGAGAHGVVNAVVALLKEAPETAGQAGLANAVLRKVDRADLDWSTLPLPGMPKWLRKPLVADYGKSAVAGMEAAHATGAAIDLTSALDAPVDLEARLGAERLPTGSLRLARGAQVTALPGFDEGWWWVQDAAAAIPARVLDPAPGERVADLCAAPGGKTLQMASAGATVTSVDISESRMARVAENLARTRLSAECIVADALDWTPDAPFDAVLLDAPCSATGTIRRHPDLCFAKDGGDFPDLFALQSDLIDKALTILRPGGRLVFCTCSLLFDEGEEQVSDVLARYPGLTVDREALAIPGIESGWIGPEGLRTRPDYWPGKGGMDGFFIALLRKPA